MSILSIKDFKRVRVLLSKPSQYPIGLAPSLRPHCRCGKLATETVYRPNTKMLCASCVVERKK